MQIATSSMNRAIQADVTNKHAYGCISLLLTHDSHQHEINMQVAGGDEYFGSDCDYSYCSNTIADYTHSKDPVQFKLRLPDRAGNSSPICSRSNDASFQIQQACTC